MTRIFGAFVEMSGHEYEYLKIHFSATATPLRQRRRNNGLSADFLADYLCTFFPGEDRLSAEKQAEIKDAVSYIANELLENAMQFSHAPADYSVSIAMYLEKDAISLYVTNSIDPRALEDFQHFIQRLLTEESEALYLERLTRSIEGHVEGKSGLGFLTMLHTYGATLAWKFEPLAQDTQVMAVTTMVRLAL